MAQGKTNAGIEGPVSLRTTVEKHVNAIFAKLGISAAPVHRRVVAVLAFLENAPAPDRLDGKSEENFEGTAPRMSGTAAFPLLNT